MSKKVSNNIFEFNDYIKKILGDDCENILGTFTNKWLDKRAASILVAVYLAQSRNTLVNLNELLGFRRKEDLIKTILNGIKLDDDSILTEINIKNVDLDDLSVFLRSTGFENFAHSFKRQHLIHFCKVEDKGERS